MGVEEHLAAVLLQVEAVSDGAEVEKCLVKVSVAACMEPQSLE